jgi:single-strand DNA-binding protein
MASLNKVFLLGNLTREPELRYTPGGAAVCEFGIAVNRRFTSNNQEKEEVCFVDIVVWGKQAESCGRFLEKGSTALLEGRLQLDQWQDKDSGGKRSRLRVVADRVQFMPKGDRRSDDSDNGEYYQQQAPQQGGYQPPHNQGGNQQQAQQGYYQPYQPQQAPQQQGRRPAPPAQNQQGYYNNQAPPSMPEDAFDIGDDAEDDIPF